MKKHYLMAAGLIMAGLTATAQNLIENPGAETWTDGNTIVTGFEPHATQNYINNFITQGTGAQAHSGSYSVKHQSQSSTQYLEYSELIPVTPGHSYTMSYWYLDNDVHARTRIWSSWMQQDGTAFTALETDAAILRYDDQNLSYSSDSPAWVQKTVTVTAPANATHFRYQIRTYRQSATADGGFIYYDDFAFIDNTTAGVSGNAIAGLKMFPNPLNGNVLNITSDSAVDKTITISDAQGKQLLHTTAGNGTVTLPGLSAGVYIVRITEENKTATKKLVVQ